MALSYQVYVTPGIPAQGKAPPGRERKTWSPTSSTLIMGERDAVVVDTFFATAQVDQLIDWIRSSGKRLTTIYSTHGHGDHFFGAGMIREAFPDVAFYATPAAIARMKKENGEEGVKHWATLFPGQVVGDRIIADPVPADGIDLEGHRLIAIDVGHTDTDGTTVLHVPDLDLVVAGDAVYNGVHQYLAEGGPAQWQDWLDALDKVAALDPVSVVCGHKRPGSDDGAHVIDETRRYIRDFAELFGQRLGSESLYAAMLERHPDRMNVGALWDSIVATMRARCDTEQQQEKA